MANTAKTVLEVPIKTALANNASDRLLFIYNAANTDGLGANMASIVANTFLRVLGVGPPGMAIVNGAANGNVTVTGINVGDRLDEVVHHVITAGNITDIVDLTDEFSITANNTINNANGTNTTDNKLLVRWTKLV